MLKLLEFQRKVSAIKKAGTNPHFRSSYATVNSILEAVKPVLNELGIVLTQPIRDGKIFTELYDETGVVSSSFIDLPTGLTPQQMGSAITYFRRYLLLSLLALETEDDDAVATLPTVEKKKPELTETMIKTFQSAVLAGRVKDVEKKLEGYEFTPEQRKQIMNP